jgi:endonuclease/exonuclease/phosphatase family metal-dependent hydrolase
VATDVVAADTSIDAVTDVSADAIDGIIVRLGTFNLKRLFDTVCDSGACGPNDFESAPAESQLRFRAGQIAQGVAQMDVDIVAIQEIESDAALQVLLEEVAAVLGDEWQHGAIGELGFDGSLDTAVISRFPITEVTLHRDTIAVFRPDNSRTSFARELLQVEVSHEGRRVVLFSAHFKSKSNDDAGRRYGEAVSSRVIIEAFAEANPDALVVLGGDLNDTPGSDPLNALEEDGGLFRVTSVLGDEAGTIRYAGTSQAIDHLYLATNASGVLLEQSVQIVRDASGSLGGSDHAAVRATFVMP